MTPVTWPASTTGRMSMRWWRNVSGDLRVAEVAGDLDVLDVDVLAHGVASAGRALVERILQRTGTNAAYCSSGR
jgi:hypothetical protein